MYLKHSLAIQYSHGTDSRCGPCNQGSPRNSWLQGQFNPERRNQETPRNHKEGHSSLPKGCPQTDWEVREGCWQMGGHRGGEEGYFFTHDIYILIIAAGLILRIRHIEPASDRLGSALPEVKSFTLVVLTPSCFANSF